MALVSTTAIAVLGGTVPTDALDTVKPGSLIVAEEAEGEWELGSLAVRLGADGLMVEQDGRTVWAADSGAAFVTGARGRVDWSEHRGYFWPRVAIDTKLAEQRVDSATASADKIIISGTVGSGPEAGDYEMILTAREGSGVVAEVVAPELDAVALVSGRTPAAGVHGFGEQFTDFDLDGRLVPIVIREQGVGRGTQPLTFLADVTNRGAGGGEDQTYAAWSTFVTDDLRGLRLDPDLADSHAFAVADTRDPGRVGLQVWSSRLRAELVAGDSPTDLLTRLHPEERPELAEWTQDGAIIGLQGGTEKVRREVAELTEAGTEISGVWLQDWSGQRTTSFGDRLWWTWQLDTERYPGWSDLVSDLAEQDIATTTYVNTFLVDAAPKGDSGTRNLWAEARDAGHLVEDAAGEPYQLDQGGFDASLVDLTDPAARDWYAQVIADEVLTDGVTGFMADFGEGLPYDAVVAEGEAAHAHNQWPLLWAETVREACELAEQPDCVTWFRAGSLGMSEQAALFWNGDQLVDFGADDGLASALLGTFSAGVSGWPLTHSDIGGYTSIDAVVRDYTRPDDLLQRWAEYAAFGVVMRTHEGNRPAANAQVYDTPASEDAFGRMTRVFAALGDYRRSVVAEARDTGVPAIRHGWLVHPGTRAAEVDTQFFLGASILMAPVLESDAATVEVTFPPGTWIHLITGAEYEGDRTTTVDAPLGTPAAFVRADDPRAAELRDAVESVTGD